MPPKRAREHPPYRPGSARLLDQVREVLRYHHYLCKTEQACVSWILRFIRLNAIRQHAEMGKSEIEQYLRANGGIKSS